MKRNLRSPHRRRSRSVLDHTLSRRSVLGTIGAASVGALAGCLDSGTQDTDFEIDDADETRLRTAASAFLTEATLYKAPNCICCAEYADYLEAETDVTLETVDVDDLAETKDEYGVPEDVESCHTMDVGEYFVEGHIPREAIGKLAEEEPDIAGIALPEMPSGSPGMPGEKTDAFVVYAVHEDGSYDEFVRM